MLQARECAPTTSFIIFILRITFESFQKFKGVSNKIFTPFKNIISENKTIHDDDVSFHYFTISFVATLLWPSVGVKPNTWKK
jgi:hypothetical protein